MASKVNEATEADWSFAENPSAMDAIKWAARQAERNFPLYEYDDAYQDALLWVGVRPERVAQAVASGKWKQFGQDVYANGLRKIAVPDSDRQNGTVSWDRLEEGDLVYEG